MGCRVTVHPHERGGHSLIKPDNAVSIGSSPRAWGSLLVQLLVGLLHRFIPTSVGVICPLDRHSFPNPVHPHERGGHTAIALHCSSTPGSSPRAWGSLILKGIVADCHRFIPTSVGVIDSEGHCSGLSPVHPHERGGHNFTTDRALRSIGSSPRAWGSSPGRLIKPSERRFIPTSVGVMQTQVCRYLLLSVHPHERGGHPGKAGLQLAVVGSSPRAWGSYGVQVGHGVQGRFIPTSVGVILEIYAEMGNLYVKEHLCLSRYRIDTTKPRPCKRRGFVNTVSVFIEVSPVTAYQNQRP
ncbi:hypothetical protein BN8_00523 [Fibrisoma limi BUZ 3]|uniref:Uncharacterized protein n=1 Tax=Fibrisoma limi BUZ 3 TaxID=1185876 RepID=I2GCG8_9BACT|nr:hypothetical protein BN8_00523 [Fibrisoma limi BUZ 3]